MEKENPVPHTELVSTTDPDAVLATKNGARAAMAYYDNYLIDTASRVILEVEATPALFHQEAVAARRMVERVQKFGVLAECLGADKAYGSGEFLAWLLERECNRIFLSLIADIRPMAISRRTTSNMLRPKMSIIVPKARLCVIEA